MQVYILNEAYKDKAYVIAHVFIYFKQELVALCVIFLDQILQMLNDPNPGVREAATSCIEVRKIAVYCFSCNPNNYFYFYCYFYSTTTKVLKHQNVY